MSTINDLNSASINSNIYSTQPSSDSTAPSEPKGNLNGLTVKTASTPDASPVNPEPIASIRSGPKLDAKFLGYQPSRPVLDEKFLGYRPNVPSSRGGNSTGTVNTGQSDPLDLKTKLGQINEFFGQDGKSINVVPGSFNNQGRAVEFTVDGLNANEAYRQLVNSGLVENGYEVILHGQYSPGGERIQLLRYGSGNDRSQFDLVGFAPPNLVASAGPIPVPGSPQEPPPKPIKLADLAKDGDFLGPKGKEYPPNTKLDNVQGTKPNNGTKSTGKKVYYVNGVFTDEATQRATIQKIANFTGAEVVGVRNETEGIKDIGQAIQDTFNSGYNPAVQTLGNAIYQSVKDGDEINIIGHSQGSIIASRAVQYAINRLRNDKVPEKKINELLEKNVSIQTFGTAVGVFPQGPQYRHVVNKYDPVAAVLSPKGILFGGVDNPDTEIISEVKGFNPIANHSIDNVYLKHIDAKLFK